MHNRTISLQTMYMIASEIQSSFTADLYIPAEDSRPLTGKMFMFNKLLHYFFSLF